jgi:hypothetical protein
MPEKMVGVNVMLGPEAKKSAPATLAKLKSAGLRDATVLEAVGIVTGRVAPAKVRALAKVAGVSAVEPDEEVHIPPPDSPTQ